MKILNQGKRAFIVKPESVIQGGELSNDKKHSYINPGATVEVVDEVGEILSKYSEIMVVERKQPKKGK